MADVKKFAKSKKSKKEIKIPKSEFIKEHKRLISILKDPNKNKAKEAELQAKELKEQTKKGEEDVTMCMDKAEQDYPKDAQSIGCGMGLAGKICRHNAKRTHKFAQAFKKSIDYKNTTTSVDTTDQHNAEMTADARLVAEVKAKSDEAIIKMKLPKGTLTLSKMEPGIFNGFFQDTDGQVVEKFDGQTAELIVKNLILKDLYDVAPARMAVEGSESKSEEQDEHDDREIAKEEVDAALEEHNALYHQGQKPGEPMVSSGKKGTTLKLRFGDLEIELRKSVRDFVNDFKKTKEPSATPDVVQKALGIWRKKNQGIMSTANNIAAGRILLENWEEYQEDFNQIVYAVKKIEQGDE